MSAAKLAQAYNRAMEEIVELAIEIARLEVENKQLRGRVEALNKAIAEMDCRHASEIWWLRATLADMLSGGKRK